GGAEEDEKPDEEEPAPAEAVGEAAGGNERGGKDDRVRIQDPGEARERALRERRANVGERDVDDRDVEKAHEHRDRGHEQYLPAAGPTPLLVSKLALCKRPHTK